MGVVVGLGVVDIEEGVSPWMRFLVMFVHVLVVTGTWNI